MTDMSRKTLNIALHNLVKLHIIIMLLLVSYMFTTVLHCQETYFKIVDTRVLKSTYMQQGVITMSLTLQYLKDLFLEGVRVYISIDQGVVLTEMPIRVRLLKPYQVLTLTFTVNTTVNRLHKLTVTITWSREYAATYRGNVIIPGSKVSTLPRVESHEVTVYIEGRPYIVVTVQPLTLSPNTRQRLVVKLCNNGSDTAYDIEATLSLSIAGAGAALSIYNPENLHITVPKLRPGECKLTFLDVAVYSNLVQSSINLLLKHSVKYITRDGNVQVRTGVTYLTVLAGGLIQVRSKTTLLETGREQNVTLTLCNLYYKPLRNVTLSIDNVQGAILLSNTYFNLDVLPDYRCRDVTIRVAVPKIAARTTIVTIRYTLTYSIVPMTFSVEHGVVTIPVLATPKLVITEVTISPKKVEIGDIITMSIIVTNVGSAPAYSINVSILPSGGLKPITTVYSFTGRLDVQDQTVASFTLNATDVGLQRCKILVVYFDEYGRRHVTERIVEIKVENATVTSTVATSAVSRTETLLIATLIGVIVVIAIIVSVVLALRRGKK